MYDIYLLNATIRYTMVAGIRSRLCVPESKLLLGLDKGNMTVVEKCEEEMVDRER